MAKRVIRLSKGGAPAVASSPDIGFIQGPKKPVRLGQEPKLSEEEFRRTQPMKRIVVAAGAQARKPAVGASSIASRQTQSGSRQQQQQRRPAKKASGPPIWLIPVGIIGVVILIVIVVSASSGSRRDPYDAGGLVLQQPPEQRRIPQDGPRPMKEWMEQHGETDMAKARKDRMKGRGTTTATTGQE